MAFSDDTIGFYLQVQNELSPELRKAEKDYYRLTKSIEKLNERASKSATKGFDQLANVVEAFRELPKEAARGYTGALKTLRARIKPIVQPITVKVTIDYDVAVKKSTKGLLSQVGGAISGGRSGMSVSPKSLIGINSAVRKTVARLLNDAEVRLVPTIPLKRNKYFDTGVSLRQFYKDQVQPPDFMGAFQRLPRFQSGGVVPGHGNLDEVLALLTPGEVVLPTNVVSGLQDATSKTPLAPKMAEAVSELQNLNKALQKLYALQAQGDPKAQANIAFVVDLMGKQLVESNKVMGQLPSDVQTVFQAALTDASKMVADAVSGTPHSPSATVPSPRSSRKKFEFAGLEDITSVLESKEVALPKDVVEHIRAATSRAAEAKDVGVALANIENLSRTMDKLQDIKSLGLDPDAQTKMNKVMAAAVAELERAKLLGKALPLNVQRYFIPAFQRATQWAGRFNEEITETSEVVGAADVRFLAMGKALEGTHNLFSQLYSGVSQTFTAAQGEQIEDFVTNYNRANTVWGVTRERLRGLKQEGIALSAKWKGLAPTAFAEVVDHLAAQKFNPDEAHKYAGAIAAVGVATGTATESIEKFTDMAVRTGSLTEAQLTDVFGSIVNLSDAGLKAAGDLFDETTRATQAMGRTFWNQNAEMQKSTMTTMAQIAASLPRGFQDMSDDVLSLVGRAAAGTVEANELAVNAFGVGSKQIQEMLAAGQYEPLLRMLTDKFQQAGDEMGAADLASKLGLEIAGTNLLGLGEALTTARPQLDAVGKSLVATGTGTEVINERLERSTTLWERFSTNLIKSIGGFSMFGVMGVEVIDVFKEINPQWILSIGYLGQFGGGAVKAAGSLVTRFIPALAGMLKGLALAPLRFMGLVKAAAVVAPATQAVGGAAGAAVGPTRSLGESISALGHGIGGFAKGVATGLGQAILGFMQGLSAGVMALLPAIQALGATMLTGVGALGFAALVGGVLALAGAIRLAAPGLEVFAGIIKHVVSAIADVAKQIIVTVGDVFIGAITSLKEMFGMLVGLDPSQMIASAGALLLLGPGFISLGSGLAAAGAGMLLASPGVLAFAGAMSVLGGLGTGGTFGSVIEQLASAFIVDETIMKQALTSIWATAEFMGAFGLAAGAVSVAAAGAVVGQAVGAVVTFFSKRSPLARLAESGKDIVSTVTSLTSSFNLDPKKVMELYWVTGTVEEAGRFMKGFAAVQGSVQMVAVKGAVVDWVLGIFGKGSPLAGLAERGKTIADTVKTLASSLTFKPEDFKKLTGVNEIVEAAAEFMTNYTAIQSNVRMVAVKGEVMDWVIGLFTSAESPMVALAKRGTEIIETVKTLVNAFATYDPASLQKVSGTVKSVADFTVDYARISSSLGEVAPGRLSQYADVVLKYWVGGESPMVKLANESATMVGTIGTLTHNFAALQDQMKGKPKLATEAISAAAEIVKGFNPLAQAVQESGSLISSLADGWIFSGPMAKIKANLPAFTQSLVLITGTLNTAFEGFSTEVLTRVERGIAVSQIALQGVVSMSTQLGPVADILTRASERSLAIQKASPGVVKALRSILSTAASVTETVNLQQPSLAPRVTPAAIQQAVSVQLDPNTTDQKVHERLGETNTLLGQMVQLLQQATTGDRSALAAAGGGTRSSGPGRETSELAAGRF